MMTDDQKTLIAGYRNAGYGYKKIAQLTGISVGTVKSYCQRKGLAGCTASVQPASVCKCCGSVVRQIPGRKEKKFCSDECRHKWWNAHPEKITRKAVYSYTCAGCGKPFTAYGNSQRKYCCHACYIADRFKGGKSDE